MGVIAMVGAVLYFWKFASRRAALILIGFLTVGVLSFYARTDDGRACDDRTWFCDLVPERPIGPPPCPEPDSFSVPIFTSDAANAEVLRLMTTGVCQKDAIKNIASGWRAEYNPAFMTWWRRLFF